MSPVPRHHTPLGFLPGKVEIGAHCMFVYPKRDEVFCDRIAGYLKAGLDTGEMCVCVSPMTPDSILQHMESLGVDTACAVGTGQLVIHDSEDVYISAGVLDLRRVMDFWTEKIEIAEKLWNGIRIFGDTKHPFDNRTERLKLLEYESKVNMATSRMSIALCGYNSNTTPRALLTQIKSVHPFVASVRSIQTNHNYIATKRFLSTFYRFQRISRVYPATAQYASECRRHFEEIAARTPMTMAELEDMKLALGETFANALEVGCAGLPADRCHIHVVFLPQIAGFTTEVRVHGIGFAERNEDEKPLKLTYREIIRNLVSDFDIERRKGDTVIILRTQYSLPFRN